MFLIINLVAYLWVLDQGTFPLFSILAGAGAMALFLLPPSRGQGSADVEYLYSAAWKRWRFFISGRAIAVILGALPFLLFTNLLDYQAQLEDCLNREKSPEILRVKPFGGADEDIDSATPIWKAFYWNQEGRFLNEMDFTIPRRNQPVQRFFYLLHASLLSEIIKNYSMPPPVKPPSYLLNPYLNDPQNSGTRPADPPPPTQPAPEPPPATTQAQDDELAVMLNMNRTHMSKDQFFQAIEPFDRERITARGPQMDRMTGALTMNLIVITFEQTDAAGNGVVFAEDIKRKADPELLRTMGYDQILREIDHYSVSKWIFFSFGIFGFIFLWRHGGDSSLSRWLGIWLVGTSLILTLPATAHTLPHMTHWLWIQSVLHHWNTLASAAQPLFNLLYIATFITAIFWFLQIPMAACWIYTCWPTRIHPTWPVIARQLLIVGKLAAAFAANFILFFITSITLYFVLEAVFHQVLDWPQYVVAFIAGSTIFFLVSGFILRFFTACAESETPRLGFLPVAAILALNLCVIFYFPSLTWERGPLPWKGFEYTGIVFGVLLIVLMIFLILKRDFLRVRARPGFHHAPPSAPASPPDSRGGGLCSSHAQKRSLFRRTRRPASPRSCWSSSFSPPSIVGLMNFCCSFPCQSCAQIEHNVEHALEKIVDAEDDAARSHLVSELFDHLHVPQYLFLSRRPKGVFAVDINKLGRDVQPSLELSEPLRKFLGEHAHFVDLQSMAYEWQFFFHQFELFRLMQETGCRFLLPVAVGESLRGLLMLPDGPGGSVVSHPAVSENINNFGIAAAISRRK